MPRVRDTTSFELETRGEPFQKRLTMYDAFRSEIVRDYNIYGTLNMLGRL